MKEKIELKNSFQKKKKNKNEREQLNVERKWSLV